MKILRKTVQDAKNVDQLDQTSSLRNMKTVVTNSVFISQNYKLFLVRDHTLSM